MRLRQIGVGHHRLPKFFERARLIVLRPIKQAEAGVGLGIIRLKLDAF